jgi:L-2-hydroxyglutarate oxidase LhgO
VLAGRVGEHGVMLQARSGDGDEIEVEAAIVINCGGLWACHVARNIAGLDDGTIPTPYFAKGNYYSLSGKAPFSHLIYPVPQPGGLGVHLTLDMGGQARFGPDVEWLQQTDGPIDYTVDPRRADSFYREIRAYWPQLPDRALQPAYSGVRPKISAPGAPAADFLFATHGNPHYLGLYGIESPGLTASLAIADHAFDLLQPQS